MFILTLETQRLVLKPLAQSDAPWIQREFPHWDIVKYLSHRVPWPYPEDGAESFLRDVCLPQMEKGEAYHWSIRLKTNHEETDEGIGVLSFRMNRDECDGHRGFWIARAHQRKGYVTEACECLDDFVFGTLKLDSYEVENVVENKASRRIKEKLGAEHIGAATRDFIIGSGEVDIWKITREQWQERRGQERRQKSG